MKFLYPEFFFLLLLFIPLIYTIVREKNRTLESVFSKEVLEKLLIKKQKYLSQKTRLIFLCIALFFMIVALARPVLVDQKKQKEQVQGFDLLIALDISKSMLAQDIFPSRLLYAKSLANKVIATLPNASIGVIAFSKASFLVSPLSEDKESIRFLLEHLNPDFSTLAGSSISSAIESAKKMADNLHLKHLNLLLISDGADGKEIDKSLQVLDKRLKVYVLDIGTKKGSVIYEKNGNALKDKNGNIVITKRNDNLIRLAQKSGGSFLSIPNNSVKIDKLVNDIKQKSIKEEKTKQIFTSYKELFIYPLSLALAFIFFSFNSLRFFLLFIFLVTCSQDARAGVFDFYHLHQANKSYKDKQYKKAYEEFSKLSGDEAKYNAANAAYKNKEYKKAQNLYEDIHGFTGEKEHERLHNLGNTYANEKKFTKAIDAYEKALKIQDDKDTKYNLDLLKKEQQKSKQKSKQKNKHNNKQNNKNKQKSNQQKNKNKQDQHSSNKQDKNSQKQKDTQNSHKNKQQDKNKESHKQDQKKQDQKASQKRQDKLKQNKEQNGAQKEKPVKKKFMSESEAKKWEKMLENQNLRTHPLFLNMNKDSDNDENW
jgi:Ca-activated chloride channel homolog